MLRIETEEEMKMVLQDTINGIKWEYLINSCPENCSDKQMGCAFGCSVKSWHDYKLGEAINSTYPFRRKND